MTRVAAPIAPDMVTLLATRAAETPESIACDYLDAFGRCTQSMTYGALDLRAAQIAVLISQRAAPGDRILLLYPPGLDFVAAFFGCLYAGVIAVPLPVPRGGNSAETERVFAVARDCQSVGVMGSDDARRRMAERPEMQEFAQGRWLTIPADLPKDAARRRPHPSDLAFLQYTSGSTGTPKGVAVRHGNLIHNVARIAERCHLTEASRALVWLPHFHDLGLIGGIMTPLYAGFPSSLMAPSSFAKRPLGWLRAISAGGYTISGGPNFAYDLCVERYDPQVLEGIDLSRWDCAFNGAERVSAATISRFTARFGPHGFRADAMYPCYGMAEATLTIASNHGPRTPVIRAAAADALDLDGVLRDGRAGERIHHLVSCGQAAADQMIAIVDPVSGGELPDGRVGEIWSADDSVAAGYFGKPAERVAVFAAVLEARPGRDFLRTGDLGVRENGEIFVVGRLKDLIIIDGRNLHPADIEATVAAAAGLSATRACIAFGIEEGETPGEGLVILLEAEVGFILDEAALMTIRRAVNERHEIEPRHVVAVAAGSLPRTSSGKVRRADARQAYLRAKPISAPVPRQRG